MMPRRTASPGRVDTFPGPEIVWTHGASSPDGAGGSVPRILFAYNGSPTARVALDVAAEWALALRAEAWVLYVRVCDVSRGGHYYVETRAQAHAQAAQGVARLRDRGVSASGTVRDADRGRVAHAIVAQGDLLAARVIVLGTRARSPLGAALLGSTSRAVARRSQRPVVLVGPACGTRSPQALGHRRFR